MGKEIEAIMFGGVRVGNAEKTEVKIDPTTNQKIYCVWLKGGAYAEFPQQSGEPVISYFAKDLNSGISHQITKEVFNSGKTEKDGNDYVFERRIDPTPAIFSYDAEDFFTEETYYEETAYGFDGLKLTGSPTHTDSIHIRDSKNSTIIVDNDNKSDGVNIGVNCPNVRPKVTKGLDSISRFIGFKEDEGYFHDFGNY